MLALADGVNWGEKSRLAARCAIRGAVEHLDDALYNSEKPVRNTLVSAFSDVYEGRQGCYHRIGTLPFLSMYTACFLGHSIF